MGFEVRRSRQDVPSLGQGIATGVLVLTSRNQHGLDPAQIRRCVQYWEALGGAERWPLDTREAGLHGSKTRFVEEAGVVFLGADVYPGRDRALARSRMSPIACLAHELGHAHRHHLGIRRPFDMPDYLIEEAEASLDGCFNAILSPTDRRDLVEDAHQQTSSWLEEATKESP